MPAVKISMMLLMLCECFDLDNDLDYDLDYDALFLLVCAVKDQNVSSCLRASKRVTFLIEGRPDSVTDILQQHSAVHRSIPCTSTSTGQRLENFLLDVHWLVFFVVWLEVACYSLNHVLQ